MQMHPSLTRSPLLSFCPPLSRRIELQTAYMPFNPTYGILNTAVSPNSNTTWWETHNATTMVDWVRWYAWVPDTIAAAVDAVMERGADPQA